MKFVEIYEPASQTIANQLLTIGAFRFNDKEPFVWSSGWRSPIYCDNRLVLSYPVIRTYIKNAMARAIAKRFDETAYIAGVATAGIAHGALVAEELNVPYVYVRSQPKGRGMKRQIEGRVEPGKPVIVIDDLISTCGSALHAANALTEAGFVVVGLAAIFTYGFPIVEKRLAEVGIPLLCMSNYDCLMVEALKMGYLCKDQIARLASWREAPEKWM